MCTAQIKEDARLYSKLYFGRDSLSVVSTIKLLCRSKSFLYLAVHRILQSVKLKLQANPSNFPLHFVTYFLLHCTYVLKALSKMDIRLMTELAGGIYLSDRKCVTVGAASIGAGTVIHHRVTIGVDVITKQTPEMGDNVWIGPDCVIYGGIKVGSGVTILPGTVVSTSIPDNAVVVGIPSKIICRDFDNRRLRSCLDFDVNKENFQMASTS